MCERAGIIRIVGELMLEDAVEYSAAVRDSAWSLVDAALRWVGSFDDPIDGVDSAKARRASASDGKAKRPKRSAKDTTDSGSNAALGTDPLAPSQTPTPAAPSTVSHVVPVHTGSPGFPAVTLPFLLTWMAPFFSGGGYCSEATSFALALWDRLPLRIAQHGDSFSGDYVTGLPRSVRDLLVGMVRQRPLYPSQPLVSVCHSEPGAWRPPMYQTTLCPVDGSAYSIGRTMFETDRITEGWVKRCNAMDEVWVPTDFHIEAFANSGVIRSKIFKVAEAVDSVFFDPARLSPLALPIGTLAVGARREHKLVSVRREIALGGPNGSESGVRPSLRPFGFLSVFKWEERKGWNILIEAFLSEFARRRPPASSNHEGDAAVEGESASGSSGSASSDEARTGDHHDDSADSHDAPVELYLLTNAFHTDDDFPHRVREMAARLGLREDDLPPIYVIDQHIPTEALPRLYRAAGCFVLPSRGEGWGRPHVEAMAMGLPVIATNWSGPTEYLNEENGYPLPISHLTEIKTGPYRGHLWAEPSLDALRSLMRRVYEQPEERARKGRKARADMVEKYNPAVVADVVVQRLLDIARKMQG
eukprot:Opistho-2@25475